MGRLILTGIASVVVMLFITTAVWAQGSAISGVVRDTTGAVLPGVTVEVSSPALIEKVRTGVTDGQGVYRIIDLRPGSYAVTFTIVGFRTVKREGIGLTANFTATVDAELAVGSVEETLTISGQSPVVDLQNVIQRHIVSSADLENLPIARSLQSLTAIVPGLSSGLGGDSSGFRDVGGTSLDYPLAETIHGTRADDTHIYYDGFRTNNINSTGAGGGGHFSIYPNPAAVEEISLDVGSQSVENEIGGVTIRVIPKSGGNTFKGILLANGTNDKFQSANLTDELRARGLTGVPHVKKIWDFNGGVGGPVVKDKIWFHAAYRTWGGENYVSGVYFNQTPLAWTYTPDLSRGQPYRQSLAHAFDGRLTWQVNPSHKVSFAVERQYQCGCYEDVSALISPEAGRRGINPSSYLQAKWTNTASTSLLLQAGLSRNLMDWAHQPQPEVGPDVISVTELRRNFTYRSPTAHSGRLPGEAYHTETSNAFFSTSYVTGSHSLTVGTNLLHATPYAEFQTNRDMTYQFLDGVPTAVVLRTTPFRLANYLKANLGLYAQDQWTVDRLTLNLGLRYSYLNAYVPPQHLRAGTFRPALDFPEVPAVAVWHDLTPRLGAAYSLFGDGKTALKVNVGKYLVGEAAGAANGGNPVNNLVDRATRSWNDANGNYVPDCDLLKPEPNGECGGLNPGTFGSTVTPSTIQDPNTLRGWGKRQYNWELSAGIQHELLPGIAVNATYFRRWYGNLLLTDNTLVNPSDYDPFCITVPVDARLPNSGQQLCGFFDINSSKFGLVNNFVTGADQFGKVIDKYDGVDVTMNARLPRGATLQGGVNVGRQLTDMCDVLAKVDTSRVAGNVPQQGALILPRSGLAPPSLLFCRVAPPFLSDLKLTGSYPLPWWDLQLSATLQSVPGIPILATQVLSNAQVAPSLGRNLAAGSSATATVPLIAPGTLYGDRLNQMDVRVMKAVRVSRARIKGMLDFYNLFNVSPVLSLNNVYGPTWQRPFSILQGRLVKLGVQLDF